MGKARRKFDINEYDFYVKEFIRKSEENGTPISHSKLRLEPFNLPDARWYITNCPDKSVGLSLLLGVVFILMVLRCQKNEQLN